MSTENTPFFSKLESDQRFSTKNDIKQLERIVDNIADGTGGKSFSNIEAAMAVIPLPNDNVLFSVDENNLSETGIYAYDSTQPEGYRFVRNIVPDENSKVEYGNPLAVSGSEVARPLLKRIQPTVEIAALASGNGEPVASTTRVRSRDFLNNGIRVFLQSPDLFLYRIYFYTDNVFVSYVSTGFVKEYDLNFPSGSNQFKIILSKNPDTIEIVQDDLDNMVLSYSVNELADINAIENLKPLGTDYTHALIDVNTSANELGAISTSTGVNVDNLIRIRSKNLIKGENYKTYQIKNLSPGYFLNRLFRYKNGTYVNNTASAPLTFTLNDNFNEIRPVFSKIDTNAVITPEELLNFHFDLVEINDKNKFQKLALNANKIPSIERRLYIIENSNATKWLGLLMIVIGDSISYGYIPRNAPGFPGQLNSYAKLAADKLGMIFNNYGISGSTVGQLSETNTTDNAPFIYRTNVLNPNADLIVVKGGTNDLRKIKRLGTMTDRVGTTYYGALHILFQDLLNRYVYNDLSNPKTIVAVTPIKIYPNETWGTGNWTIKDYRDAMIEVANYYAIPIFDAWALSGMTPEEFRTLQGTEPDYTDMYNPLITDGVHPTQEGHEIFATAFVGFLKTLK